MYNDSFTVFPRIETERLVLRKTMEDDIDAILEYTQDNEYFKYTDGVLNTKEIAQNMIQAYNCVAYNEKKFLHWGICLKSNNHFIGRIYMFNPEGNGAVGRKIDIGFEISQYHGRNGYAAEAIRAVTEHGFREMGLVRIQALIIPENIASIRACIKAGYIEEGKLRNFTPYYYNEIKGFKTMIVMSCFPDDEQ
ncbi:MAG: GNAT family N-acetyltransferase [Clostridiales bacterium]|nr:GNAT family N-acetyltransferase [Clostridiales bacterium]